MLFAGLGTKYVGEDFKGEQKFIVSRHSTDSDRLYLFNFFGVDLWPDSNEEPQHAKIVEGFKIKPEDVLGGGRVRRASPNEVLLYDLSGVYGGVPREFLEYFRNDILKGYHSKFPEINRIVIDTPEQTDNDEKVSFLEQMSGSQNNERDTQDRNQGSNPTGSLLIC